MKETRGPTLQISGVRTFHAEKTANTNNTGIDVAYLKAKVLEQSEQRKGKESVVTEVPRTIAMGFVGHLSRLHLNCSKSHWRFYAILLYICFPFYVSGAHLIVGSRRAKVEVGEHLGNYCNNIGKKLPRGSEWRWREMRRCWVCF